MTRQLYALTLLVAFAAACGSDAAITTPEDRATPGPLLAIGTDPVSGATIETDLDDYMPGEIVHLTGRGWAANETVRLFMTEDPDTHEDVTMDVVADSAGGFSVHFYDVQPHDLGVMFTLTATGQTSGSVAVATFTDGNWTMRAAFNSGTGPAFMGVLLKFPQSTSCDPTSSGQTTVNTPPVTTSAGPTTGVNSGGQSGRLTVPTSITGYTFSHWSFSAAVILVGSVATDASICVEGTAAGSGGARTFTANYTLVAANTPPVVDAGIDSSFNEGASLIRNGSFTDPDADTWTATVDYGDGSGVQPLILNPDKTFHLNHQYHDNGSYTVTVTVSDGTADGSDQATMTVNNVAPSIGTKTAGANVDEGSTINFSVSDVTDPSSVDVTAGFEYAFACDGTTFGVYGATASVSCPAGDGPGSVTIAAKARDKDGGESDPVSSTFTVLNVKPTITAASNNAPVSEGSNATMTVTGATDPFPADLVGATYAFSCNGAAYGAYSVSSTGSCPTTDGPATITIAAKVKDKDGAESDPFSQNIQVDNVAPTLTSVTGTTAPTPVNTAVSITLAFTDPAGTFDTYSAAVNWDDGLGYQAPVALGAGNTVSRTFTSAGVYTVCAKVQDEDGGVSSEKCYEYIVVYDPAGGFVTGGGWIMSPEGAYLADPGLTGKATFGFVSKYEKGKTYPTGNTEFQFHAGNLNFKSTSYEWLVVSGPLGQYKGVGSINGAGNYGFLLTAKDGQAPGGGGVDQFRIKIWAIGGSVVYDNALDAAEDSDASTALGGGSIVIHTKK